MKHYLFKGYAKQKGKDEWDKFLDTAVFPCPDNENPYNFFDLQLKQMFDYWLIEYKEIKGTMFDNN